MKTAGTLIVAGTPLSINNSPVTNNAGWQLIGCPYPTAAPIVGIFGSRFSEIKDFEGSKLAVYCFAKALWHSSAGLFVNNRV